MKNIIFILMLLYMPIALAQVPALYDRHIGKYLGNLNANQYDPNSVHNQYGRYGSKYSPDSINNQYGQYGSQYSPNSVHNPYAISPPVIIYQYGY